MYTFPSQAVETAYLNALSNGNLQKMECLIHDASGHQVSGYKVVDSPSIEVRCVEDEEVFNIAEMYVGELNIRIRTDGDFQIRTVDIIGGTIEATFYVQTDEVDPDTQEYIYRGVSLGKWNIADARRDGEHFVNIKAYDQMSLLSAPMGMDNFVGEVTLTSVMNRIKTVLGFNNLSDIFAQTPAEVEAMLIANPTSQSVPFVRCTHYEKTCWDEVRLIAQLIGGFAFADRDGKIRFRNFNDLSATPVLTIPADRRFHADLQEGIFAVSGVTYTDEDGEIYSSTTSISSSDSSSIVSVDYNKYIMPTNPTSNYYINIANNILAKLSHIRIIPGSVDFYGDPALDLGDMVLLTNTNNQGIGGPDVKFLITGYYWQFRGPQTITAGGAQIIGKYVVGTSYSGQGATPTPSVGYTKEEIEKRLNNLSFTKISKTDFDALNPKDPDTVYYVFFGNGTVKEYIGNIPLSGGGSPVVSVAARIEPRMSSLRSIDYSATPPADECEITRLNQYTPSASPVKARENCIAILAYQGTWNVNTPINQPAPTDPPRLAELQAEGWNLITWKRFSSNTDGSASTDQVIEVFWRENNGSYAGIGFDGGESEITFIYGAKSYTKVFEGYPENELLTSVDHQTMSGSSTQYVLNGYGFTTTASSNKKRLYILGNHIYRGGQINCVKTNISDAPVIDSIHSPGTSNLTIIKNGWYDFPVAVDQDTTTGTTGNGNGPFMFYDNGQYGTLYWLRDYGMYEQDNPGTKDWSNPGEAIWLYDANQYMIILEFNYENEER